VLERTDELRAALLSAVSHDLRTPLSAITAAAGSLLQEDVAWDDANRRAFASQIEREANRLNRLVGNLLDLSRIEAGAIKLDRQWFPLASLVDDTIARMDRTLAQHEVVNAVADELPPIPLDYVLMQQVLTNLLENAAKYAPAGTTIRVSAALQGEHVQLRVEDQGPGVPHDEQQRVFESFYRVTQASGATRGTADGKTGVRSKGLGLAVCAGFVAAHGGRIWVEDGRRQPRTGAVFVVELPLTPSDVEPPRPAGAGSPAATVSVTSDEGPRAPTVYRPRRTRRAVVA
jgi:two-component system sensor histidine kinase KdpD